MARIELPTSLAEIRNPSSIQEQIAALKQDVTTGKESHERAVDDFVVADDYFADFTAERGVSLAEIVDFFFRARHIGKFKV